MGTDRGRRALLRALAAAGTAGLAGCANLRTGSGGQETRTDPPPTTTSRRTTSEPTPIAEQGFPQTICSAEIIPDFGIEAIDDPAFGANWDALDDLRPEYDELTDDSTVIGVERDGVARAYPLAVLWLHEIVNDAIDRPLLVTYCPLCRSGLVAERVVDGEPTVFEVSGQLWQPPAVYTRASEENDRAFAAEESSPDGEDIDVRNDGNLVMFDRATRSFWSQLLGRAICGEKRGERLSVLPSTVTTWGAWRERHDDPSVLLPPPQSGTVADDGDQST